MYIVFARFREYNSKPRAKARAACRLRTVRTPHAQPGLQTGRLQSPLKYEDPVQKACTAEELCVHSFCAGSERSQHRRGDDGGRARRCAL